MIGRKDSGWTILQLHRLAFEQCRKPLSLRSQPLLPSYLNASAIPCGDFSSHFKNFGSKGKPARTQKQQKSNEIAALSLLFGFPAFLLVLLCFQNFKITPKSPHTVWPPLFNGRAEVPQNGKLVGCVLAGLLCVLCLLMPAVESSPSPAFDRSARLGAARGKGGQGSGDL